MFSIGPVMTRSAEAVRRSSSSAGLRCGRVDERANRGPDAVRPDQEVGGGGRPVREVRGHGVVAVVQADDSLAVDDADATGGRLVVERPIEVAAQDELHGLGPGRGAELGEPFAGPALQDHGVHGPAHSPDRIVEADDAECVQAVGGDAEAAADAVGRVVERLVDGRLDPGLLQCHRGYRSGDAAADDGDGADVAGEGHDGGPLRSAGARGYSFVS